jgi:hypothetical protein
MTQKQIILNRLKSGKWFSTVECVHEFHILRLGARIFDLRADGYNIIERKVAGKSWSEYKLIPAQAPAMPPAFESPQPTPKMLF